MLPHDATLPLPDTPATVPPFPDDSPAAGAAAPPANRIAPPRARGRRLAVRAADAKGNRPLPSHATGSSRWTIAFIALSAVLAILVIVLWAEVGAGKTAIRQSESRLARIQAGAAATQVLLNEATTASPYSQLQLDRTRLELYRLGTTLEKSQAEARGLQGQLAQQRVRSGEIQAQLDQAKGAALKHQEEADAAAARTTGAQIEFIKARTDLVQAQAQLVETQGRVAELQDRLDTATAEIARLKLPARPAKR